MSDINASSTLINATQKTKATTTSSKSSTNELSKDTFLQLMITKLSNQDPLNPTDDTEFLAQLAQFTSLEQMISMNDSVSSSSAVTAFGMVGKHVVFESGDSYYTGKINSVIYDNGQISFDVDGAVVSLSAIKEVLSDEYAGSIGGNGSGESGESTDEVPETE